METTATPKAGLTVVKGGPDAISEENINLDSEGWKHSYLDKINATLIAQQSFIDMLQKRIDLKPDFTSEYEVNEYHILCVDTKARIDVLKKENAARSKYMKDFVDDFEKKIAICNEHFTKVVDYAKKKAPKFPLIQIAFEQYANPSNDAEKKISFFYRLLQLTGYKI